MATDDRNKALDAALGQIEKQFGKGSIMRMGENLHMNIESIPTGALALDLALGIGGLPRGRIVELYGPESSGKSTLAMHVVAEAQRNGGVCAYIDAEHAMDPVYARAIGVNVDDLLISQPDTGEQALEIVDMLIRSGALALDLALGIGGLPRGRIVEIFGPESSGKSTLAMHVVAEAQRNGGICAYIDAEHAMDPVYAKNIGVNIDDLLISQPDTGEQALEIADMLIRSGALDVLVIDSVAALTPRAEIEGEMGDSHVGLQARLMSQALRKLTGTLSKSRTIAIFINQLREKIGVMYGSPEVTPGGRALKFYSSVRLDIRRTETIKDGSDQVGNRTRVKVVKNKVSPPFKQAEFDITFGKGISREGSLLDVGVELGFVKKSGAWFTYEGEQLGQGRENVKQFLIENPQLMAEIDERIREHLAAQNATDESDTPTGAIETVDPDDEPITLD